MMNFFGKIEHNEKNWINSSVKEEDYTETLILDYGFGHPGCAHLQIEREYKTGEQIWELKEIPLSEIFIENSWRFNLLMCFEALKGLVKEKNLSNGKLDENN